MIPVNEANIWDGQNLAENPRAEEEVDEERDEGVQEEAVAKGLDNVAEDGFQGVPV